MKTAFQYIRISQEDQSNFSLSGQDKMNDDFAAKHGIQIVQKFVDDGYSAKNFDRPSWKELEISLSKNRSKIDYLIVTKYDRLIRNAAEGLAFIEKLEQRWDIKLLSVMENFFIDPHSPFFFKMRADLLVNAEFERRVISDRSKFGVWSAKSQGRFIGVAPFGYDNQRDERDKPIIVINQEEKPIVEEIFTDFIDGVSLPVIMNKVRQIKSMPKGHGALERMLCNHAYAGLIVAPAYKDEVSKIVKGTHEAIIPEDVFWSAYYKLQDKIRIQGPKVVDENVPLRGFLICQSCGGLHTGGKSKGKRAYYYYYKCNKCNGENYSSIKVDRDIAEILNSLSLKKDFLEGLRIESEIQLNESLAGRDHKIKKLKKEYTLLKSKIDSLEEKYITDKIEQVTYTKWHNVYTRDLRGMSIELNDLKKNDDEIRQLFNDNLHHLSDLTGVYNKAGVDEKQAFLKGIFPGCLTKEKTGYRTPYVETIFEENLLNLNGLIRLPKKGEPGFVPDSLICTRNEKQIEHFLRIIDKIMRKCA